MNFILDNQAKTNWNVIGVVVFLAVLVGGGALILLNQKEDMPQIAEITKQEIPQIDETADWKTYRNEEFGFEVKYPFAWTFKVAEASSFLITFYPDIYENNYGIPIAVVLWFRDEKLIGEEYDSQLNLSFTETDLAGSNKQIFYYLHNKSESRTAVIRLDLTNSIWGHAQGWTPISREPYNTTNEGIDMTFRQILSTFRFIE